MAYVYGILICLGLPGLVLGLLKPSVFKPVLGKRTSRLIVVSFFGLLTIIGGIGGSIHRHQEQVKKAAQKPVIVIDKIYQKQLESAPKSGDVQFTILTKLKPKTPLSGRLTVVTNEKDANRLITLNDKVRAKLTADGNITTATQQYFIDYFDDSKIADSYFKQLAASKTTNEKLSLASHYTAVFAYNQTSKESYLYLVGGMKTIKKY